MKEHEHYEEIEIMRGIYDTMAICGVFITFILLINSGNTIIDTFVTCIVEYFVFTLFIDIFLWCIENL